MFKRKYYKIKLIKKLKIKYIKILKNILNMENIIIIEIFGDIINLIIKIK